MPQRHRFRERSQCHEQYADWRAELEAILAHEPVGRFANATEDQLVKAWMAKQTPWRFFDDNLSDVVGRNVNIDDIPVLGEDD